MGLLPASAGFAFVATGLALAAIAGGLLSSTLHLGHPERAWRAMSQWRTSWLSREGLVAVVTFVPAGLFAAAWVFGGAISALLGLLAALGAVATVYCTAMIYASLKPIQRWNNGWVAPNYLAMGAMTGALWLHLLCRLFAFPASAVAWIAVLATVAAMALKLGYWRFIDGSQSASTPESATGLGRIGKVRLLEAPHTSENYLLEEMGFRIARKHARKLRLIALLAGFVAPCCWRCWHCWFPARRAPWRPCWRPRWRPLEFWWNAGCSSPKPGIPSCCTTVPQPPDNRSASCCEAIDALKIR